MKWIIFMGVLILSAGTLAHAGGNGLQSVPFRTGTVTMEVRKDPFSLMLMDEDGRIISQTLPFTGNGIDQWGLYTDEGWDQIVKAIDVRAGDPFFIEAETRAGRTVHITVETSRESVLKVKLTTLQPEMVRAVGLALNSAPEEKYRGMGQRFNGLELRGREIPTDDQEFTVPLPFFLSSAGYGLYVETNGVFTFDFCTRDEGALTFRAEGDTLTFFWIYGPDPADMSRQYTRLTGRMMLPPKWAFSMWKWRDWVWDEKEVYEDATMLRSLDIPAGVIFIDSPWSNEYIDYEFNPLQFPDPEKMISDLHQMGYKVLLWIVPYITPYAATYREAEERGYFVRNPEGEVYMITWWNPSGSEELGVHSDRTGAMIDFTNPAAVSWWQGQLKKVVDLGIDGFKMDDGEQLPDDALLYNGHIGREMKHYMMLYYTAVHDLMEREKPGDFVIKSRAAWPGSQTVVPVAWGADQNADWDMNLGLPSVIRGGQSMALCGFPYWGSDVGGYRWSPRKELFIRWAQFGAFCPIMEVGGKSYHEPWMFDSETVSIFRRYAQLHTHMFPYLWHYATMAAETGDPMIRPLLWHFPHDSSAWEEEFEYMLGEELLVAPMYRPGNIRSIYLPEGTWMDFWSGEVLEGPVHIESYLTSLSQLPLFLSVTQSSLDLFLDPLLSRQLTDFESHVDYFTQGVKKYILKAPIENLLEQMEIFRDTFPGTGTSVTEEDIRVVKEGVQRFLAFLQGECQRGQFPDHVCETLGQRLEMVDLNLLQHESLLRALEQ